MLENIRCVFHSPKAKRREMKSWRKSRWYFPQPIPTFKKKNSHTLYLEILKLSPDFWKLLDRYNYKEDVFAVCSCQLRSFFLNQLSYFLFPKWNILYYIYQVHMPVLFLPISFSGVSQSSQPVVSAGFHQVIVRDSSVHMSNKHYLDVVLMKKVQNH